MNHEPKTVRELFYYLEGRLNEMESKIESMQKWTFWVGGLAGSIIAGIVVAITKLFGGGK